MSPERVKLKHEDLAAAIGDHWPETQVNAAFELLNDGDGKFPSGIRKLPPDLIRAVQHERLIVAMLRAAAEFSYRDTTVQQVIEGAGVSRPTFYDHFANKEECFLAAVDATAERLCHRVAAAAKKGGDSLRDRLRLGLETVLRFAVTEPDAARTLVVEARAASGDAMARRAQLLDHFADCIDQHVRALLPEASSSSITAPGIVGGVEAVLYSRLNKGDLDDLESLLPSLMYFLVLPFEGREAAAEELSPAIG